MAQVIYLISIVLSLYMGVLFFRKWNLKSKRLPYDDLVIKAKNKNIHVCYLSYADENYLVPIGLPVWLLFLIIIVSFIPILNIIFVITLIVVLFIIKFESKKPFTEIFGESNIVGKILSKIHTILIKKI